MNTLLNTLSYSEPFWFNVLVLSACKAALLLTFAALATTALRNYSASLRHGVWSLALAGVLLLPIFACVGPSWSVDTISIAGADAFGTDPSVQNTLPTSTSASQLAADTGAATSADTSRATFSAVPWGTVIWAAGALLAFLYFLVGACRVYRWASRSQRVTREDLTAMAQEITQELGLIRSVSLRWSTQVSVPMAYGTVRPVVLLPYSAAEWSAERMRAVLLHELVHVRRFDPLVQQIAQAACVINWFNPLVWWGASRLKAEREQACDDRVLLTGMRPSVYARHLLSVARALRDVKPPAAAVSMARPSDLGTRVRAILDPAAERSRPAPHRTLLSGLLLLALLVPLAAMRPAPLGVVLTAPHAAPGQRAVSPMPSQNTSDLAPDDAPIQDVVRRSFQVEPGGRLHLQTDRGSIQIESGNERSVQVAVHRDGSTSRHQVSFDQRGSDIHVQGQTSSGASNLRVQYVVTVPQRYNVRLQTAGGSISVDDLNGEVEAQTAGGSLHFGQIDGRVRAKTSGGSVQLERSVGNVAVETSGGSISVGRVRGNLNVRTSGGSIRLGTVSGNIAAETSGGSISIDGVGGRIRAKTSGGSISARFLGELPGSSQLETAAGNITVRLPENAGVNLDAETSLGRVSTDFPVSRSDDDRSSLHAQINGGGPALRLHTSAGSINIQSD